MDPLGTPLTLGGPGLLTQRPQAWTFGAEELEGRGRDPGKNFHGAGLMRSCALG